MHSTKVRYHKNFVTNLVRYDDTLDLWQQSSNSKYANAYTAECSNSWAGGSYADFVRDIQGGSNRYTERADKLMNKFGTVALETLGTDMDYNMDFGMLDTSAYNAGELECVYGMTPTFTDRAPIRIYLDQWISASVSSKAIEMRGVACLALLQALSIHRPVMLDVVLANRYTPTSTDTIQRIEAPKGNLSLSAYMVASPCFVRQGLMSMTYHHGGSGRSCRIPMMQAGHAWQSTQLGKWLAEQDGVDEDNIVFLPMMFDNGIWTSEANTVRWIKKEMKRLMGDAYVES